MKNWKTTIAGILTAVGLLGYKIIAKQPITAEDIALAAAAVGIGSAAKDHNVTGGTTPQ